MDTPHTAAVLSGILSMEEWTQQDLQDRTKIDRTIVSTHLSGKRPVRDEHLAKYIAAVPVVDKPRLLAAWLRDLLPPSDLDVLLDPGSARVNITVADWVPELPGDLRQRLSWLAAEISRAPDLQSLMVTLTKNFGYRTAPGADGTKPPITSPA